MTAPWFFHLFGATNSISSLLISLLQQFLIVISDTVFHAFLISINSAQ